MHLIVPRGSEDGQTESAQVSDNKKTYDDSGKSSQKQAVQDSVQVEKVGADLQKIIEKWDALPEHVRQTIKMLVESSTQNAGGA